MKMPPKSSEIAEQETNMDGKNFEQHEIDHFSQYSNDWMDFNGTWKILHLMNKVRIPLVVDGLISAGALNASKKTASNSLQGIRILDVGCGAGILTEALAYLHADIVGLDAADDLIVAAREHSKRLNEATAKRITYVCDTIEEHANKYTGYYDVVVASEVVEHVNDKESFLNGCAKALKPGGSIFVTTINKTLISFVFAKLFGEYILGLVPIGTHSWFKFVNHRTVEEILNKGDCKKHNLTGWYYRVLQGEWEFCRWTNSAYALHMVKNK